ncbi:MAG: Smr/MutS family protein [bacterium]|nr:Smr/MutS family protein [bacterium]
MPFPKNIEAKLGFVQVRELLETRCLSPMGMYYVSRVRFANKLDVVEKMLKQSKEFYTLLVEDSPFPNEHYLDVSPYLHKAKIEEIWLLEEELQKIKLVVRAFLNVTRYFKDRTGKYIELEELLGGLVINDLVVRRIDRVIDEEGNLRPNASPELSKISAKIQEKEGDIRKRIQRLFDKFSELGYLTDQIGITIREGRLVLPVLAEHKRHVPGFVHDESSTGQTVFIEPTDCFDLNNLLREWQIAYRRERERILVELTNQIRPEIPELERNLQRLGLFDFIRAKGLLALEMKAVMPILSNHPGLQLVKAFHPLLKMSHDKAGLDTVSLNIEINREKHIVVISGPNAGGKSVCLKTVGLLQYMLQCGLLIPCESHSEVGIFKEIMVDIGDEQSIENDLSTYSSHLLSMKSFCDFADSKTLFLIDEFGTGTDPQFGGPLAEAILHHLAQKKAFGIVTTHFSNLKNFANQYAGLENASMLFDHEKMQPLYVLELGKPGSSYAFELAVKSGLNQHIINYAKNKVGDKQRKVDELLVELEKEKQQVDILRVRSTEKEQKAQQLLTQYELLKTEIEANKKLLIKKAKQEALALVSEANSRIEATIREIKEKQADSEVQRKARNLVKEEIMGLKSDLLEASLAQEKSVKLMPMKDGLAIMVGDAVRLIGQENIAEVVELQKNKALVAMGDLRATWSLDKMEKLSASEKKSVAKAAPKGLDMNVKMQLFSHELNIIGRRGDEAMRMMQEFLDEAILLGIKQLRIVHGKGYGILRKLVRTELKLNKFVAHYSDEQIELGGDGVTIVTLNL